VTQELFEEEIPRRELCELDTLERQRQRLRDQKTQAIKNLASLQGKIFYQYFEQWRRYTEFSNNFQAGDMRHQMIYRYKRVIHQAFTRWVNFRTLQVLEEQRSVTNRAWETRNRELLGVIKGEEAVIGDQKHRQKVEACKALKKLVMDAFNRHIQIKFAQWQRNIQAKIHKV
jgi:hypothetical protein